MSAIVILAGGRATRLPGKLFVPIDGEALLARIIRRLDDPARPLVIATTKALEGPVRVLAMARRPDVTLLFDLEGASGPLPALAAAAAHVVAKGHEWFTAFAGDMPDVDLALVAELEAVRDAQDGGCDAVVAVDREGRRHPLAALYRASAVVEGAEKLARAGERRLQGLLGVVRTRIMLPESPVALGNMNTAEDLERRVARNTSRGSENGAAMQTSRPRSHDAFARARAVIPGGVNSTVRAFKGVGGEPVFVASAKGCTFVDLDGHRYIDYVMSWGPLILGHAAPSVIEAIRMAALLGTSYGAPTEIESELAELVVRMVPSAEKVRFCSSGTEATMFALRLARGITGRAKVVKFAGCYHGSADAFLVSAGSSALTIGVPDSAGVTPGTIADTLVAPYNDAQAVAELFAAHDGQIAAIIVEPYVGNMGLVLPQPGFLQALRALADAHGALLIFDEVMTGFRVAPGGVQEREGILPDLTTLGKIIGGGLPVGAVAGPARHLDQFTPDGKVFQAGTLSGNPLAMAAGVATLRALREPGVYATLERAGARFTQGLSAVMRAHGVAHTAEHRGSMVGFFLTEGPVTDLVSAKRSDTVLYARFFHAMLERGVYLAPSQFEAGFLSLAHDDAAIDRSLAAADDALRSLAARTVKHR